MKLGTVQSIDSTSGLTILFDGEEQPTTKNYKYLKSYVPAVSDRVLVDEIGNSYVIIGAITDSVSEAGRVTYASEAWAANKLKSSRRITVKVKLSTGTYVTGYADFDGTGNITIDVK